MEKNNYIKIFISVSTAFIVSLLVDAVLVFLHVFLSDAVFFLLFALLALACILISKKRSLIFMIVLAVVVLLAFTVPFASWKYFRHNAKYSDPDNSKDRIFGNQKVMFIVPHEDDELSLGSGLFEQYLKYGSEVYVVFVTNGDKTLDAEVRLNDTLSAMEQVGIPKDNIVFLGYGDDTLKTLYLSSDEKKVFKSPAGHESTYALSNHKAFNEGRQYTRENFIKDIIALMETYEPDTVFVSDYDMHPDHEATSLFFEEAIGKMLQEENDNVPKYIYKSFTYPYSMYGYDDFYDSMNIMQTKKTRPEPYITETNVYSWKKRVRLPVNADTLSRSIYSSDVYQEAFMHETQGVTEQAGRIISGDKVFWYRSINSILYTADITSSSPNAKCLNDFKLYDSSEYFDKNKLPDGGLWEAKENDKEKVIRVVLDKEQDISMIRLYDNPSLTSNILEAKIVFDNGHLYYTGPLAQNGEYTKVLINETGVKSFEITILKSEGNKPGLTEIEAFNYVADTYHKSDYIKVVNGNGDFVYDYIVGLKGEEKFSLYTPIGYINVEDYKIEFSGERYTSELNNGYITIKCFTNGYCYMTVTDGYNSDTVRISNPNWAYRIGWAIDRIHYQGGGCLDNTMILKIINIIKN